MKNTPHAPASAEQVGGNHYKQFPIQPAEFSERNKLSVLEASVVKRVCRHSRGGKGVQDIDKAIHELQLLKEYHYAGGATPAVPGTHAASATWQCPACRCYNNNNNSAGCDYCGSPPLPKRDT